MPSTKASGPYRKGDKHLPSSDDRGGTDGRDRGAPDQRWDPPGYEIALQLGFLDYSTGQLEESRSLLRRRTRSFPPMLSDCQTTLMVAGARESL